MQENEGLHIFKQKVWEAIVKGSVAALETVFWELITVEVHSGRSSFRRPLVRALDGSELATEAHRNELLQRFAAQSGAGDADAQCLIGILLCFQGGQSNDSAVMPAHGVKFLHAAAERHNNLATLLLALCFECGKGVEVSTDAAKQCYNMAAARGYQMAQIFLKELVRDSTASASAAQHAMQLQSNFQPAGMGGTNPGSMGGLGAQSALQGGMYSQAGQRGAQFNALAQNTSQVGHFGTQLGGQSMAGNQLASLGSGVDQMGSLSAGNMQELIEQKVQSATHQLRAAVQDRDVMALARAIEAAQDISNQTGRPIAELNEARSIVSFIREHQRFPEPPAARMPSRGSSPTPSHRSAAGGNANISPTSLTGPRSPSAQQATERSAQPSAAERGDAFFQQGGELEIPMEPLEQDVDKTPSEQPLPTDVNLEELGSDPATAPVKLPVQALKDAGQQHPSPAVGIPRRGTSSHGSIGDRRTLVGNGSSVAESEPPLTREALDLFDLAANAGSRSAPNSHRDTFDRLSVASLQSLQAQKGLPDSNGEADKAAPASGEKALSRSASTRPPSPAASAQEDAVRRTQSALGVSGEEAQNVGNRVAPKSGDDTADIERLVSAKDLAALAERGISLEALKEAAKLSATTDPEKLGAFARSIRQQLQPNNASQPGAQNVTTAPNNAPVASPFGAVAGQQPAASAAAQGSANGPQNEEWGKLMQALHANVTGELFSDNPYQAVFIMLDAFNDRMHQKVLGNTGFKAQYSKRVLQLRMLQGLEGETLLDYLHNLRMVSSEDPNNDMVVPPAQSIPGIEAVLGALQAQGAGPSQQAEYLQLAAAAARQQATGQLNLAALGQQPNVQRQNLGQSLPQHLQGLTNELTNPYGVSGAQSLLGGSQGLGAGNSLGYSQMNHLGNRQYPQMVNSMSANYGQASAPDMSHLMGLNSHALANRLPNGSAQARSLAGSNVMAPPLMPQARSLAPQNPVLANYNNLTSIYSGRPGLGNVTTPGILGATASIKNNANRLNPGLPFKPLVPEPQRSVLGQNPMAGNQASLGPMNNLNSSMAGATGHPWGNMLASNNRVGGSALGGRSLPGQGLQSNLIGSGGLGSGIQGLQGFQASIGSLQPGSENPLQPGNMHSLQQGMGLQGLPNSAAFQNLRLSEQLQSQNAQQPVGQSVRADQGQANPSYALFKPPSSSLPGSNASGQNLQGSPSQHIAGDNLWSTNSTAQAPQATALGFSGGEGQPIKTASSSALTTSLGAQQDRASESGSASLGILTKDAEMQARLKPWGAPGPITISQGLSSQPLGASEPLGSLAGWNTSEALQLQQSKSAGRNYYPGLGLSGDDSLAQAFRQKPPRPVGASAPFSSQPPLAPRTSATGSSNLGLLGQSQGIMNAGAGFGGDTSALSTGFGVLGSTVGQSSTGIGYNLGTGLGASSSAASGGLNGGRFSNLFGQPRPNRFPG